MIPLYDLKKNTMIDVSHLELYIGENKVNELLFKHIDGIYSLCYYGDIPVHLSANTKINLVK